MSVFVPPGYFKLSERSSDNDLRGKLAGGALQAFYVLDDGRLAFISKNEWVSSKGDAMFALGHWAPDFHKFSDGWAPTLHSFRENIILIKEEVVVAPPPTAEPPEANRDGSPQSINKGGSPGKNWDRMWRKVASIANTPDGLPERADLVRLLRDWMAETGQEIAGNTTLVDKLRPLYEGKDVTLP